MHLESLLKNEKILENFRVSRKALFVRIIVGVILVAGGLFVSLFFRDKINEEMGVLGDLVFIAILAIPVLAGSQLILKGIWFYLNYQFILTNHRIIEVQGVISKRTISSNFVSITDIIVKQDPVERFIFNTGTIYINTAGSPQAEIILLGIDNPYLYKQKIRDLAEKNQTAHNMNDDHHDADGIL